MCDTIITAVGDLTESMIITAVRSFTCDDRLTAIYRDNYTVRGNLKTRSSPTRPAKRAFSPFWWRFAARARNVLIVHTRGRTAANEVNGRSGRVPCSGPGLEIASAVRAASRDTGRPKNREGRRRERTCASGGRCVCVRPSVRLKITPPRVYVRRRRACRQ